MQKNKKMKLWTIVAVILLLASIGIGTASTATFTVRASGGADYTRIQDAINNASIGDTILVYSGTYHENVNVNKQLILKGIDNGGGKPVVDANKIGNAITLSADGITLEGFLAFNTSQISPAGHGIHVNSKNNIIRNNTASKNGDSIYLNSSSGNTLSGNIASNITNGISLQSSSSNMLSENIISNNTGGGIALYNSNGNTLNNNTVSNKILTGGYTPAIMIVRSYNNIITNNNVNSCDTGIWFYDSGGNILRNNIFSNNFYYGITISGSYNNMLDSNTVSNNYYAGISMSGSSNNIIYNNIFNNTNNVEIPNNGNANNWSISKTPGTNIVRGSYIGGNFWAHPNGTGFSQTCIDSDYNGICDLSYILNSNNIDYLPLTYDITVPATEVSLLVNLTALDNDGGSGVNKIEYSFDGTNWNTYTAPFTVSAKGNTTVYYRSTDNTGNVELNKILKIQI